MKIIIFKKYQVGFILIKLLIYRLQRKKKNRKIKNRGQTNHLLFALWVVATKSLKRVLTCHRCQPVSMTTRMWGAYPARYYCVTVVRIALFSRLWWFLELLFINFHHALMWVTTITLELFILQCKQLCLERFSFHLYSPGTYSFVLWRAFVVLV